jgi:Holliday junction DNA helicase RuvA
LIYWLQDFISMIEYIKGELTEVSPTMAVVEAHGVGYAMVISLNTFTEIQSKKEVKLYVHEAIVTGGRDDSYTLYGFADKQERELYRMLITVSGVGSGTARMILSASSPAELVNIIASGDERSLKGVKGIGLKTAQRIIVDLRDKMAAMGIISTGTSGQGAQPAAPAVNKEVRDEAVGALTMLGFSPAPSSKVVTEILKETPDMPVEQVIKQALKMIK